MDVTLSWKVSSRVEGLVETVVECKKELTSSCFAKYGRAKLIECNVYASAKVLELFQLSDLWAVAVPEVQSSSTRKRDFVAGTASELVADFTLFKLHRDKILSDETVRVLALFDVDDTVSKLWYGNVHLVA